MGLCVRVGTRGEWKEYHVLHSKQQQPHREKAVLKPSGWGKQGRHPGYRPSGMGVEGGIHAEGQLHTSQWGLGRQCHITGALYVLIKICGRTDGVVQVHPDMTVFCLFKGLLGEWGGGMG